MSYIFIVDLYLSSKINVFSSHQVNLRKTRLFGLCEAKTEEPKSLHGFDQIVIRDPKPEVRLLCL